VLRIEHAFCSTRKNVVGYWSNGLVNTTTGFPGAGLNRTFQVVGLQVNRWTVLPMGASGCIRFNSPERDLIGTHFDRRSNDVGCLFNTGARIYFNNGSE
jgi:hypothetical protein